jgi:UDP-N-acetylmuramoylalanine--D-glutamate ligase
VIDLNDQNVLILGLGASGLAMARWCARLGARVTVADTREQPPNLGALLADVPQAEFLPGAFDPSQVTGGNFARVFVSPGLTPTLIAPILVACDGHFTRPGGELDLFTSALEDLKHSRGYSPKVLAVTGTNGKTTVTALTGQLVERAGKSVAVAGNIGPSLLDTLTERLDSGDLPEVWVLELSSFQLHAVEGFEPTAATVLNISQDHLDWHGSMQAYAQAKAKVFGASGLMLLNRNDAAVMAMLPVAAIAGNVKDRKAPPVREHLSFGADAPTRPGDFGIEDVNGMAWLVRAQDTDGARRKRNEAPEELFVQRLMPADALRIRGRHNAVNALAALALASAAGCALAPMLYGLREYRGEPHRVESIGTVNGVEFFDDSKGTNVGATVAALSGLGADRKLVVILGGDGKGQDFAPLAGPVSKFARSVVLIGRDAPAIRAALAASQVPLSDAGSMHEAVAIANRAAHAGDAVLMSPACASFDMFDNYGHRAAVFCDAVKGLANEAGLALEAQA